MVLTRPYSLIVCPECAQINRMYYEDGRQGIAPQTPTLESVHCKNTGCCAPLIITNANDINARTLALLPEPEAPF